MKDAIYEKASRASGFLIDGFPRKVDQGKKKFKMRKYLDNGFNNRYSIRKRCSTM